MTESEWVPFGLNESERADYTVLRGNVTPAARQALISWLRSDLLDASGWANIGRCLQIQLATDVMIGAYSTPAIQGDRIINELNGISDKELLRVVDYVLVTTGKSGLTGRSASLAVILKNARSRWTAGTRMGRPGLTERVPSGVQDFVEDVVSGSEVAGRVLSRAWAAIHGLEPEPSAAYGDAVRAVEIVAVQAVQPRNAEATLGTVLGQMKADGDWRLPMREHKDAVGTDLVLSMLRTLWYGHRDRHGKPDYSDVSPEEARAAVSLAASAVDWFASGALTRRPAAPSRRS